jgi:hypothetical protein
MTYLQSLIMASVIIGLIPSVSAQVQSNNLLKISQDDGTRRGLYYNCGYGYSFIIPRGHIGRGEPDGLPQHGVRILLSEQPESYVWVDGSFNGLDWQTLEEAANHYQESLREQGTDVSVVRRQATRLGRLQALRLVFSYREERTENRIIEEVVLARRRSREESEIIYTIGLKTPQTTYESRRRMFENVLRTWRLRRLPCF